MKKLDTLSVARTELGERPNFPSRRRPRAARRRRFTPPGNKGAGRTSVRLGVETAPQFLVIDFHSESRFLLVKTLLRKFPGAVIHETDDADHATEFLRALDPIAVITHRTFDCSGAELVKRLREAAPDVLIVMVSGMDREAEALAAGANAFLHYDEWLRIASVVESLLRGQQRPPAQASDVA